MEINKNKTAIVITTIFEPTEALKLFAKKKDYHLIVVGDKKTPKNWHLKDANYISIEDQLSSNYKLSTKLPFNHYCRKMLGYLEAINMGAKYIIDTDDDNIPYDDWSFPSFVGPFETIKENMGFVNIYQLFTEKKIWPRGLPLKYINQNREFKKNISVKEKKIGIWQALANDDPDVDAIYRLTSNQSCYFNDRPPIVLESGTICPFNTQNTIIRSEIFSLLYLPTFVTFRFTDILRSLIAQPILWLYNYSIGFTKATVIQKRNPHDYMKDFISEIPMYQHCEKIIELTEKSISKDKSIQNNLHSAYNELNRADIITTAEMQTLDAWLLDLNNLNFTNY